MMDTKDILTVEFRDNGGLDIQFSEGFLASSQKDQVLALQDFYREKSLEANSIQELSYDLAKSEQILMVVEALLGKVKRGGRIEGGTDLEISLEDLMYPTTNVPII